MSLFLLKNTNTTYYGTLSASGPGGPDPTNDDAACFPVPDVDARGNTVTHGFILVPATGPYVQQGGVRGHCII